MKKKALLINIIVIIFFNITGCSFTKEIEHLEYVNSVGIDSKDGKVYIYAQIINFTNIAKQSSVSREPETISIGKGVGNTIEDAVIDFYNSAQQRIAWSQTKSIIFSKSALKNQKVVTEWLDILDRYYEFRHTVWAFGTDKSMDELLNTKQILNISSLYSRLNDPMDMYKQNSFIKPLYLFEFTREWNEPGDTILLPVISVKSDNWKENQKRHPMLEVTGIFPIKDKKYTTFFPNEKIFGVRWINKETIRTPLFLNKVNHLMLQKPRVKIIPSKGKDEGSFSIEIKVKGFLTSQINSLSNHTMEKEAEKKIKEEILSTYEYGLENKVDLYNLSHTLYRKDIRKWRQLNRNNYLKLKKDSLKVSKVTVVLNNSGLAKSKKYLKSLDEKE